MHWVVVGLISYLTVVKIDVVAKISMLYAQAKHRSAGLGRTRLFHPWGREPEGGWSGSDVSMSHVVRPGLSWTQVSHL